MATFGYNPATDSGLLQEVLGEPLLQQQVPNQQSSSSGTTQPSLTPSAQSAQSSANQQNQEPSVVIPEPLELVESHKLMCTKCKKAFPTPSKFEDHKKAKSCNDHPCKQDHEHDAWLVNLAFRTENDALIHLNANYADKGFFSYWTKDKVFSCNVKKCKCQFRLRESTRYLKDGGFTTVWVILGCAIHTTGHGKQAPLWGYCTKSDHDHNIFEGSI